MPHLTLLGNSIFDNTAYTAGGPAVIDLVRQKFPAGVECEPAGVRWHQQHGTDHVLTS